MIVTNRVIVSCLKRSCIVSVRPHLTSPARHSFSSSLLQESGQLVPWTTTQASRPAICGLQENVKRLMAAAEKLDMLLPFREASPLLQEVKNAMARQEEREIVLVLVGESGSGKSHLGNRSTP